MLSEPEDTPTLASTRHAPVGFTELVDASLVALRVRWELPSATIDTPTNRRFAVTIHTAFLVHVREAIVVVTAGHVLERLQRPDDLGRIVARIGLLPMGSTSEIKEFPPSQFVWGLDYNEVNGNDVGLLIPPREAFRQLNDHKCGPIGRDVWASNPPMEVHRAYVYGFPKEEQVVGLPQFSHGRWQTTIRFARIPHPVEIANLPQAERRPNEIWFRPERSYPPERPLVDWNGMSGGPILTLTDTGKEIQVSLLAVQCAVRNGLVCGSVLRPILSEVERNLQMRSGRRKAVVDERRIARARRRSQRRGSAS